MILSVARGLNVAVYSILGRRTMWKSVAFGAVFGLLWLVLGWSFLWSTICVFILYLVTGGYDYVEVAIKTFPRDFRGLRFLIHSKRMMNQYRKNNTTIIDLFQENVRQHPNKIALVLVDGSRWTFREVDEYSNQIGNYFHEIGFSRGDVAAIFKDSSPEFVCLWLGLAKAGVIAALINFNLRQNALAHCIKISNARALIVGNNYITAVEEARHLLPSSLQLFNFGDTEVKSDLRLSYLNPLVRAASKLNPPREHVTKFNDTLFYVYTSGTTGLPKAAIVIHSRFYYMASSTHYFFYMTPSDIVYDSLPLYHTAGGVLGIGQMLIKGCTVVIRPKFSASRFWDDCIKYNCTVAQYIGEICRYLLAQPIKAIDQQHRVRMAFGNGLRPQIWSEFMQRFNIERIGEFYGATEGNANIINIDNKVGAVGFTSRIAPAAYPVCLIKVDKTTGEPIRQRNGMCIICEPGEEGELVGKVIKGDPLREFDGYVNREATSKKLTHDVFKKGDVAFLTGDVLMMDRYGYCYFRDRIGDTYRWRGENVSTSEVEATVSNVIKLNDAVAYGVEVPGSTVFGCGCVVGVEGRAGMVAIVDERGSLDLEQFYRDIQLALPPYARPVFIRVLKQVDVTGTFKLKKTDYRREGFDPGVISDSLFYLDSKSKSYQPITPQVFSDIDSGKIRL